MRGSNPWSGASLSTSRAVGRGERGADGARAGPHEVARTHRARGLVCVFVAVASAACAREPVLPAIQHSELDARAPPRGFMSLRRAQRIRRRVPRASSRARPRQRASSVHQVPRAAKVTPRARPAPLAPSPTPAWSTARRAFRDLLRTVVRRSASPAPPARRGAKVKRSARRAPWGSFPTPVMAVRVVGAASAAVGLFLVAVDCLSLPSRASSADAPEEKEADELEAVSPTSPPDIPT